MRALKIAGRPTNGRSRLVRDGYEFYVVEHVEQVTPGAPPVRLLDANKGEGRWWSGNEGKVELKQGPTSCALAAAAADASFPARDIAEFVSPLGVLRPQPIPAPPRLGQPRFRQVRPLRTKPGRDALFPQWPVAGRPGPDRRSNPFGRRPAQGNRNT